MVRRVGGSGRAVVGVLSRVGVVGVGVVIGVYDCTTIDGNVNVIGMAGRRINDDAVSMSGARVSFLLSS